MSGPKETGLNFVGRDSEDGKAIEQCRNKYRIEVSRRRRVESHRAFLSRRSCEVLASWPWPTAAPFRQMRRDCDSRINQGPYRRRKAPVGCPGDLPHTRPPASTLIYPKQIRSGACSCFSLHLPPFILVIWTSSRLVPIRFGLPNEPLKPCDQCTLSCLT